MINMHNINMLSLNKNVMGHTAEITITVSLHRYYFHYNLTIILIIAILLQNNSEIIVPTFFGNFKINVPLLNDSFKTEH